MSTPALELTGLKKSFGKAEIIRGIDLEIGKAERHAIKRAFLGLFGALFGFDGLPVAGLLFR